MSMETDCDVLVAGAGLVGLSLAPALAGTGLSVALVDHARLAMPAPPADELDWDARVYAISPGSAAFLRALGAWHALSHDRLAPVEAMHVEGDTRGRLDFSAYELGERALAWIVEERALRAALIPLVHAAGVLVRAPAGFESLSRSGDCATLRLAGGGAITARLVIGADGVRSWTRAAAGIPARARSYGQTAVVANFSCERAHRGIARQWFVGDGGVLAWLPLPGRRVSMVWSAPVARASELLALAPRELASRVAVEGRHVLGALECITPAAGFPLNFVRPQAVVDRRVALVGDAAHGVHPLAGQGVNLGFGDAEALAAVLRDRGPLRDPGAAILLDRYARRRAGPVLAMQTVTDGLARLFGATAPWVRSIRNAGMAAVDGLAPARRLLARSALR